MNGLCLFGVLVILAASLEARRLKCSPICPDCVNAPEESFRSYATRYLEAGGPADGVCTSGVKSILFGKDYGKPNNACCCLHAPAAAPIDCGPETPQCPPAWLLGLDESAIHYFARVGRDMKGAPTNGCCPEGTIKWMFAKEYTGAADDICTCLKPNKMADANVVWQSPSSPSKK